MDLIFYYLLSILLAAAIWLFYATVFAFIVWMVVDAAKQDKFFWVILIAGIPIIGASVYYFVEKKKDYMTTSGHFGHVHAKEKKS